LERGARYVRLTNRVYADLLGIEPAARTTCVKPEGTTSLLLGSGSGIHPHHAPRSFRRVQANRLDPVYRHFRARNPHLVEESAYSPETDDVITFAIEAPPEALCREDVDALTLLELVHRVQKAWVRTGGEDRPGYPGLCHNVSNTISVGEDDWDQVADYIWAHRRVLAGVALLAETSDNAYPQMPRQAVVSAEDNARWVKLRPRAVNYRRLREERDVTAHQLTAACAGGQCELLPA
jgi:ribonucleoside-diphosphate reductase alpha chain